MGNQCSDLMFVAWMSQHVIEETRLCAIVTHLQTTNPTTLITIQTNYCQVQV